MKKFGTAVILSGGLSRRMGYDKKQLRIGGENIINRIVKQLSVDFDDIIIAGSKPEDLPGVSGVRGVYPDAVELSASLVGIYTGLLHARSQYLYVTACDMPVYNHDFVVYMQRLIEDNPGIGGCVTRYEEWIEPFNSFYHVELAPKVASFLETGRKSIYKCFERENLYYIDEKTGREFSPDWDMFCNLNTPSELKNHIKKRRDLI
ncbi:molybdenum cofactor guanylyltransferase [Acetobacterium malicum]|uniref:Probable molybdenum cofactor guanylyltransferase n=1 Tax=Acetobacterium malicum TaxID=52692 RepID=A0ABR6Z1D5_9FIRM|nr:molybdenum cofactor guanylyltransferase [Acetobacterium malicum]MBC3901323.1 NTP transferase domain-containing protein [Acetobacterium malicum]